MLVAAGGVGGWFASSEIEGTETVTQTTTVSVTTTEEARESGLPDAVEKTRAALLAAAEAGDYRALRPLIPQTGFKYTVWEPRGRRPSRVLAGARAEEPTRSRSRSSRRRLCRCRTPSLGASTSGRSPTTSRSVRDLTAHERELLAPLGPLESVFVEGTGYLGWRAGIQPDGTWVFFVAGD